MNKTKVPCCILCGSIENKHIGAEKGSPIYRCRRCGLVYVYPLPGARELAQYYLQYDSAEKEAHWEEFSAEVFRTAANRISKYKDRGKLLDVGCGYGFFMRIMKERGWDVRGLELDSKVAQYAAEKLSLDVIERDIRSYCPEAEEFDLITLWWVLEHLPEPLSAIKRCKDALKRDGMLIIRVPNINFVISANRLLIYRVGT